MLNSVAAGRRLALRAVVYQLAAVLLVALVSLLKGGVWAGSVMAGGATVVVAGLIAARVALGGGVRGAGTAFGRLLMGMLLKWFVVILGLGIALAGLGLPPLPVLVGVVTATLAFVVANSIQR